MLVLKCGGCADIACAYWPTALGRKPSSAGEVSSNPWPHQKTMHLDLSRLVGLSLLLRQLKTPQWFTIAGFFYDFRGVQFR
jgi:hypothetical protein